jgi:hypothetical protein
METRGNLRKRAAGMEGVHSSSSDSKNREAAENTVFRIPAVKLFCNNLCRPMNSAL